MDILRINTTPTLTIVPRRNIEVTDVLTVRFTNENMKAVQDILADSVSLNENETYLITLDSFPSGEQGDKLSYILSDTLTDEVLVMGKALIASETESIQDFTKANNNKFYK